MLLEGMYQDAQGPPNIMCLPSPAWSCREAPVLNNLQNHWPKQLCKPSPPRYQWIALTIYINLPKSISLSWICVFSLDVSWLCIRMKAGCTAPSVSRKHRSHGESPAGLLAWGTTVNCNGETREVIHLVSQFRCSLSGLHLATKGLLMLLSCRLKSSRNTMQRSKPTRTVS